ncbi:MAG: sigma-70 family RNA polymerase sigma factor [Phycisphaerae bacterium]|nr:sigma-70 family RNA polymerase sigma factor [Phycisphaerae bacterium]
MGGTTNDAELVAQYLAGRGEAFDALYAAHGPRIAAYFARSGFAGADADDLTQQTFVRAARSLGTFDAGRGAFGVWLSAIAHNVARRHFARRPAPANFDPELAEVMLESTDNPAPAAEAAEEIAAVRDCVGQLPDELGRVIRLRYVEGRTTRGVSAAMTMPEATVRLRLGEARAALERCLREKGLC